MNKTTFIKFSESFLKDPGSEQQIEDIFKNWHINEMYFGNIDIFLSSLVQILQTEKININGIFAELKGETLFFKLPASDFAFPSLLFKEYKLDEMNDETQRSVFLMQKICDNIYTENNQTIFAFYVGPMSDNYFLKSHKNYQENYC